VALDIQRRRFPIDRQKRRQRTQPPRVNRQNVVARLRLVDSAQVGAGQLLLAVKLNKPEDGTCERTSVKRRVGLSQYTGVLGRGGRAYSDFSLAEFVVEVAHGAVGIELRVVEGLPRSETDVQVPLKVPEDENLAGDLIPVEVELPDG
jgi:hypothetical protein